MKAIHTILAVCIGLFALALLLPSTAAQNPCMQCAMPHCCAMYCGGTCCLPTNLCFECGNCFCECTCGTSNCPSSGFWTDLTKNATGLPLSAEERERLWKDTSKVQPKEISEFLQRVSSGKVLPSLKGSG